MARSRYSVLYVLIYMGDRLIAVSDRKKKIHIVRVPCIEF